MNPSLPAMGTVAGPALSRWDESDALLAAGDTVIDFGAIQVGGARDVSPGARLLKTTIINSLGL